MPQVSIVITTRNEEGTIGRLITSLKKQSFKNSEIIVVDNNSTDKTGQIARRLGIKIYQFGPERSAQRNFGAKKAKGKYLLFLDADMELTKDVVKECVKVMENDLEIGAVTILEQSIAKNFWEKVKAYERSFYNSEGDDVTDAARFFSKKIFNTIGGYDESITGPEDWDITDNVKRAGYKIGIARMLIFHYERIPSVFALAKKKFYYGLKSHRYLSKQNVSTFSPKTIYFLRPVFYKNPLKLIIHPVLTAGMILMLGVELMAGGLGFMLGRFKKV